MIYGKLSGFSTGGPEWATTSRSFSGPFIGTPPPPLFKEDIMSFLDFLIFYRKILL